MAGPWESYAPQPPAADAAPWQNYAPTPAPAPTPSDATPGLFGGAWDALRNVGTGIERGISALVGTPAALREANAPAKAEQDAFYASLPPRLRPSGVPNAPLPTAADTQDYLVQHGGPNYVPRTALGRVTQAGVAGGTAGLVGGPIGMALGAAGGATQQGLAEAGAPNWMQAFGGVAVPVLLGAGGAGIGALRRPMTTTGQMQMAQRLLDEAAVNRNAPIGGSPIAGAPSSLGQATNDPGLLAFEKGRFNSSPQMAGEYRNLRNAQNQAATDSLQTVGQIPNRGGAAQQMQDTGLDMQTYVQNALKAAKTRVDQKWAAIDPGNTTAFDTAPVKAAVDSYVNGLTKARRQFIPSDIQSLLDNLGPQESLSELQDTRSAMLTAARGLRQGGKYNEANVVQGLADEFGNQIENLPMTDPAMLQRYQDARAASAEFHRVYGADTVEKALKGVGSTAGDRFLRSGRPEDFNAYFEATGGSPQAMQAARDYFLGGLTKAAESAGAEGQQFLSAPYTRYLNSHRALLEDQRLFTPDQRQVIQTAGDMLDYGLRTERSGMRSTSPTYQLLSNDKFAEAFLGKKGAALVKMLSKGRGAAATALGAWAFGPTGAVVGSTMGEAGAVPFAASGRAVLNIVDRAVRDPAFAANLRAYRQNPNMRTLVPLLQGSVNPAGPQLLPAP